MQRSAHGRFGYFSRYATPEAPSFSPISVKRGGLVDYRSPSRHRLHYAASRLDATLIYCRLSRRGGVLSRRVEAHFDFTARAFGASQQVSVRRLPAVAASDGHGICERFASFRWRTGY